MRLPALLLALVVASALLLGAALLVPEPEARVAPHPEHPTLLVGGDGGARVEGLLAIGWAFGAVQLAFFAGCFVLGLRRAEGLGPLKRPLLVGVVLHQLLWAGFFWSYGVFLDDPLGAPRVGSLPLPTAWMVYGLWPFPLFFAVVYLRHFDGWVLSEDDLVRFRARVAELRQQDPEGPRD